ncbi:MAG: c-type cytochrome [Gammaproteobacteria bacterium]|nr:c-type cytochrome [Gammaproteobacteria bacterium]
MLYRNILLFVTIAASVGATALPDLGLPVTTAPEPREVALGKKLFMDRRLSANGTLSCAMCHIPEQGFAQNQLATPVGFNGRTVKRNSPTLLNVAYRKVLFHDGREFTLANQVWSPLLSAREMGNVSIGAVIKRLQDLDDYETAFEAVFDEGISITTVGAALAAYENSLIAGGSPFDEWRFGKNTSAVTSDAKQGFSIFIRHGCSNCHTLSEEFAQFTDDKFYNTGIGFDRSMNVPIRETQLIRLSETVAIKTSQSFHAEHLNDLGRYEMTGKSSDKWKYRTPTLRNVALTAPYMHDGSISSLRQVVEFYMKGGIKNDGLDPRILPFTLNETEIKQLLSFLESLTSPYVEALVHDARDGGIGDY